MKNGNSVDSNTNLCSNHKENNVKIEPLLGKDCEMSANVQDKVSEEFQVIILQDLFKVGRIGQTNLRQHTWPSFSP